MLFRSGEVRLRSSNAGPGAVATAVDTVSTARWVFAGPGSPTYTARNWLATGMERAFTRVLEQGSLVFASAAAMSLGSHVMPVYEIYRVGQDPHWQPGLDVIGAALGVKAAVVAHYDNTEGGTHDTRYCFAGADRFATLEAQLPADTGVIGVDEHTAVVIDLDEESVAVHGRGGLTLRSPGGIAERVVPAGAGITLAELRQVFVAAESRDEIRGAQKLAQRVANRGEHTIAGDVAVLIVEGLEVVDVDHHQTERLTVLPGASDFALEHHLHPVTVAEARKSVGLSVAFGLAQHSKAACDELVVRAHALGEDHEQVLAEHVRPIGHLPQEVLADHHQVRVLRCYDESGRGLVLDERHLASTRPRAEVGDARRVERAEVHAQPAAQHDVNTSVWALR